MIKSLIYPLLYMIAITFGMHGKVRINDLIALLLNLIDNLLTVRIFDFLPYFKLALFHKL